MPESACAQMRGWLDAGIARHDPVRRAGVGMIARAINRGAAFRFLHKPREDREPLKGVRDAFGRIELEMTAAAA